MNKKIIFTLAIIGVILLAVSWRLLGGRLGGLPLGGQPSADQSSTLTVGNMKISSPAFGQNQEMPEVYTCDGQDISPPLTISGVPETAQSLALIVNDPDAPMGNWIHWTAWNLSPGLSEIQAGQAPEGAEEGQTSFGSVGYGGPCPPSGTHRYFFQLFALDARLELPSDTDAKGLEKAMEGHVLDKAGLVGTYSRQ